MVMHAENYEAAVEFYKNAFDLDIIFQEANDNYSYTELGIDGKHVVGITPAADMKHTPTSPRNNSTVLQLYVEGIEAVCASVKQHGGEVHFGPEKGQGFNYGGVKDLEGNEIWLFEPVRAN